MKIKAGPAGVTQEKPWWRICTLPRFPGTSNMFPKALPVIVSVKARALSRCVFVSSARHPRSVVASF